jgi:hypothetical protein
MIRLHTDATVDWAVRLVRPLEDWLNHTFPLVARWRYEALYLSCWRMSDELDQLYVEMDQLEHQAESAFRLKVSDPAVSAAIESHPPYDTAFVTIDIGQFGVEIPHRIDWEKIPAILDVAKAQLFDQASSRLSRAIDAEFERIQSKISSLEQKESSHAS